MIVLVVEARCHTLNECEGSGRSRRTSIITISWKRGTDRHSSRVISLQAVQLPTHRHTLTQGALQIAHMIFGTVIHCAGTCRSVTHVTTGLRMKAPLFSVVPFDLAWSGRRRRRRRPGVARQMRNCHAIKRYCAIAESLLSSY